MSETMTTTMTSAPDEYQVRLEAFSGPMDLLLYLIKKEEVDIYDIPIANITRQYLQYIELMKTLNLEVAGEFILMAATLIRIKTRMLLPRDPEEGEEGDPREELILALIEYRKYKEAGDILRDRALLEERNYVPPSPVGRMRGQVDVIPSTTVWDMITAFKEVMQARHEELVHHVENEPVSIEERIEAVMRVLRERESATFIELFTDAPLRIVAVVTFIALLELARSHRIAIRQAAPFTELRVYRGEAFDAPLRDIDLVEFTTVTEPTHERIDQRT
ncbi:MAG: segregation/condensation protein A [Candidatus Zixiibacteriota bacterium]|nr:MAG: segregation/condensation protein A [candidate division Zixibacteria bacterium]